MIRFRTIAAMSLFFLLATTVDAATSTWTNAAGDGRWSTMINWSPAVVPSAGSDLVFPDSAGATMLNDLPSGTQFKSLTFNGCSYRLQGNSIVIAGSLDYTAFCTFTVIEADVTFAGPDNTISGFPFEFDGAVEIAGGVVHLQNHAVFKGPLRGSGTFQDDWYSPEFDGGSFTGQMNVGTAFVRGDLPGANFMVDRFYGNGTIGSLNAVSITLGTMFSSDPSVGVLHTKDLVIRPMFDTIYPDTTVIDILPGGFDRFIVNGTVTLNGKFGLGTVTAPLTPGQTFVVIDNDGSDPVNGTFTGLPEGSLVSCTAGVFKISYHGGDGNDVTLTMQRSVKRWTGAGGNALFSNAANWSPTGPPVANDVIDFPAGTGSIDVVEDLFGGITFASMSFERQVHLSGNSFNVSRGFFETNIFINENTPPVIIDNDVTFSAAQDVPAIRFRGHVTFNGANTLYRTIYARFEGPLSGNAAIQPNYGSAFVGGGDFSGSIIGEAPTEIAGGFPNADVAILDELSGSGVIGSMNALILHPGSKGTGEVAQFQFKPRDAIIWSALSIDIAGNASDRLVITGPATLQYASLIAVVRSGAPVAGTTYVIIDNRTATPIGGTFTNLPEGAILDAGGFRLRISYKGGDGNDVTLTVVQPAKRWTGAANNGLLSTAANWSPAGTPVNGDSLFFPDDLATTLFNDLPADTEFESVGFVGTRLYGLTGHRMVIKSALTWNSNNPIAADLKFSGDVSLSGLYTFNGAVEIDGHLTYYNFPSPGSCYDATFQGPLNGAGTFDTCAVWIRGSSGNFSGTITSIASTQLDNVNLPGLNLSGYSFYGSGIVGDVTAGSWNLYDDLQTKALTMTTNEPDWLASLNFVVQPSKATKIRATKVTLTRPVGIYIPNPLPAGTVYTLIDNIGNEPVHGTFAARPEGATWTDGAMTLRISYQGGDGNDVTLTVVKPTTVTLAQSSSTSRLGEKVTLIATATSEASPSGTITFYRDGTVLGTVDVVNGTATLDTRFTVVGAVHVMATFTGTAGAGNGSSPQLTHTVTRALPQFTIASTNIDRRALLTITANHADGVADAPTGSVSFSMAAAGGSNRLVNGIVTFPLGELDSGTYPVIVHYDGDSKYDAVDVSYDVVVAPPVLDVRGTQVVAGDSAVVVLRLSNASRQAITAHWTTTDGTATAGNDYLAASGDVTFAPNQTAQQIVITTLAGTTAEKSFTVSVDTRDARLRTPTALVVIAPKKAVQSYNALVYATRATGPLTLDLYLPTPTASATAPKPPLIVAIEARDWSMPQETNPLAIRETARGYAVAVVRFRLSIEAKFPAQLDDVNDALAWLRVHGAEYQVDSARIALWGIGAGGHLAALSAMTAEPATRPLAVVDWYGPTDLTLLDMSACTRLGAEESLLLGCSPDQCAESARSASPLAHVGDGNPPFLIMHGGSDCSLSVEHSVRFDAALHAAGTSSILDVIANVGGYDDPAWRDPAIGAEVDAFIDMWLRAATKQRGVR